MLGSLIGRSRWRWTIWGKHPSAGDYLNRGLSTRVEQAISSWIRKGYNRLNSEENDTQRPCVWRFWTQATGNHTIACGIISNSADHLGRPYPLLIMGTGKLKGWEQHWEYLPVGLGSIWRQMEQLSTYRAEQFCELERALDRFQPPAPDWSNIKRDRRVIGNRVEPLLPETKRLHRDQILQKDRESGDSCQIVPLTSDPIDAAMEWNRREKTKHARAPSSLFLGGPVDIPHLVVFTRALAPSDFICLWTLRKVD